MADNIVLLVGITALHPASSLCMLLKCMSSQSDMLCLAPHTCSACIMVKLLLSIDRREGEEAALETVSCCHEGADHQGTIVDLESTITLVFVHACKLMKVCSCIEVQHLQIDHALSFAC